MAINATVLKDFKEAISVAPKRTLIYLGVTTEYIKNGKEYRRTPKNDVDLNAFEQGDVYPKFSRGENGKVSPAYTTDDNGEMFPRPNEEIL